MFFSRPHFPVSDHCNGRRFFTPGAPPLPTLKAVLRWQFTSHSAPWPKHVSVSSFPLPTLADLPTGALSATWINHASFLLQHEGLRILTDPLYGRVAGLFDRFGPRRVHSPGIAWEKLPPIDVVLLSHDHYDHCDLPTLRALARRNSETLAIGPLGNGTLFRRAGFKKIVELDWWESHKVGEKFSVTLTPAQHWSKRITSPRCGRLWGGFYLTSPHRRVHFVGDTGYHAVFFKTIAERLGAPNLALIPIGAYEPRWFMRPQHCNPAEAVQIHRDLQADRSIAMHWGCFQLTDEARTAPVEALREALDLAGIPPDRFRAVEPGETCVV